MITSADELKTTLSEIEEESISNTKKTQKKLAVMKQMNIRKKVLRQKTNVPFTTKGKQRSLSDIIKEFSAHLQFDVTWSASTNTHSYSSESLVGRSVLHKFEVDDGLQGLL